jgi:ubiquinone/menaquinone biosynthesis C-methylase UbiE
VAGGKMPTVEENRLSWGQTYNWTQGGEEWSQEWGSAQMQWFGAILPRISSFVPADTILEIAPGHGRWTAFLRNLCRRLILVDLAAPCIERCQERFASDLHISYFVNDGTSLGMVEDASLDFIFCFDSLVHAEDTVLKTYMAEFSKKLRPNGAAFIHHSNLGAYQRLVKVESQVSKIPKLTGGLTRLGVWDNVTRHWRARSMTAEKMAMFASEHNLQCVSQELIAWKTKWATIDCFSTIVRAGSRWSRENRVVRNTSFMQEARSLRNLSFLYEWGGPPITENRAERF